MSEDWPKREDGTNMEMGEMNPEDRKRLLTRAALRWRAKMEGTPISPAMDAHLTRIEEM